MVVENRESEEEGGGSGNGEGSQTGKEVFLASTVSHDLVGFFSFLLLQEGSFLSSVPPFNRCVAPVAPHLPLVLKIFHIIHHTSLCEIGFNDYTISCDKNMVLMHHLSSTSPKSPLKCKTNCREFKLKH